MSAFIVNDNTINAVLGFADKYDLDDFDCGDLSALGQLLVDENYRSTNYRYSEDATPHSFVYSRYTVPATAALQHLSCIEYQLCEPENWETTLAFRLCARLRKNMVSQLLLELGAERAWDAPSPGAEIAAL